MMETILEILVIILLLDLIVVLSVGAVWFCLWAYQTIIKELWQEIKEAQEEE